MVLQAWAQHPHLGRGPPVLGSGSQLGRHSGMSPQCCRSGLAHRAEAAGHTRPHLPHTSSHGSQQGKHSGKSRAGFRRPRGRRGLGSGCIHPRLQATPGGVLWCDSRPPHTHHATLCLSSLISSFHPLLFLLPVFQHSTLHPPPIQEGGLAPGTLPGWSP